MSWRDYASCQEIGPDLFFMPDTDGMDDLDRRSTQQVWSDSQRAARKVCIDCAVLTECRLAGLAETHGMWAGAGENRRQEERRNLFGQQLRDLDLRAMVCQALEDLDHGVPWDRALEQAGIPDTPFFHDWKDGITYPTRLRPNRKKAAA